jgi:hypothetical protein
LEATSSWTHRSIVCVTPHVVGDESQAGDMTKILEFIASYMGYLWKGARFQIVGSRVDTSFGTNAVLLVESERLRLRFVSDRDQLFLDLQPADTASRKEWFSIDIVRRMLRGQRETSAVLDSSYAEFLRDNLDEIEARFSAEHWQTTREEMRKLEVRRSKELFG